MQESANARGASLDLVKPEQQQPRNWFRPGWPGDCFSQGSGVGGR